MKNFEGLLRLMARRGASDLFITAGLPPSLKVNGTIGPIAKANLSAAQARELVYGVMSPEQRAEFDATHEANFALSATGIGRFRVSAFIQRGQPGMVLRRIQTSVPTLEELRLPPILRDLVMLQRGLVIMVGATGTGKSTSLAAMIGYRNQHGAGHIVTIEDPIEFMHQHGRCIITQREVGIDTESYEVALRNTLRQAPDVILIGEVRARETMNYAIAFAEIGHLCLLTLHANNANQALDRIINFFPEDRRSQLLLDLSFNLRAIVAQQLIPKADVNGRTVVVEILLNTPLMAELIRCGEIHQVKDLMKRSTEQGMRTFDQALHELYRSGEISAEQAIRYADSANEVRLMIKLGKEGSVEQYAAPMAGISLLEPGR